MIISNTFCKSKSERVTFNLGGCDTMWHYCLHVGRGL